MYSDEFIIAKNVGHGVPLLIVTAVSTGNTLTELIESLNFSMCETQINDVTGVLTVKEFYILAYKNHQQNHPFQELLQVCIYMRPPQDTDQLIFVFPADKCTFKVSNRNKVGSKLTIKTLQ